MDQRAVRSISPRPPRRAPGGGKGNGKGAAVRVLVATIAETTNMFNLVPVAWALRAAGHEVVVASQPELGPTVAGAGLPFAAVGRDHNYWRMMRAFSLYDAITRETPPFGRAGHPADQVPWEYLLEGYRRVVPWWWRVVNDPMADDLVDLCRTLRPDLVVWDPISYAAPVAARACGAAHVRVLWGLDTLAHVRGLFVRRWAERPPAEREDPLASWLGALARRHGTDYDEELVHGQATVVHTPPSLAVDVPDHVHHLPVRHIPYNGRALLPDWLRTPPHRPRVCLTLGRTATERQDGYAVPVGAVLAELARLDAEVVATLPAEQRRDLGPVPANVRLVDRVPLHALAPTCALVVSHGGTGTVWAGLDAGVPQLVVPRPTFDEPLLGRRIAERGAGAVLAPDAAVGGVRAAAERLLGDPGPVRAARELAAEMRGLPAPAALVRDLAHLAGRAGRPGRGARRGAAAAAPRPPESAVTRPAAAPSPSPRSSGR
jgi:glycosyltransferase (activator-dependent family)